MTIEQAPPQLIPAMTPEVLQVVVTAREQVAADVVALTLVSADGRDLPRWRPGAHVDLTLPTGTTRQYSLSGDPGDRSSWRIAVLREPASRGGSSWIHDEAAAGTMLTAGAPRNLFPLEDATEYVFIAGGVGITPILPMIAEAERAGIAWTLWYGGRSRATMAFVDELEAYGDRVHVVPNDTDGLIPLAEVLGTPRGGAAVYSCGPEPMLAAVTDRCATWEPGALHVERFTAAVPQVGEIDTFEVHCERSGVDVTVGPDVSVLDALLEAGVEVDYSCTAGFCGTCETRVIEGVPDHQDTYLEPDADHGAMMICVSRSKCPRLVLDL